MYEGTPYQFIGQNGSMGLRRGTVYNITIQIWPNGKIVVEMVRNSFLDKQVVWRCPYTNVAMFSRNWVKAHYV